MSQCLEQIVIAPLATYTATIDPLNIVNTSSPVVNNEQVLVTGGQTQSTASPYLNYFYQGVLLLVNVTVAGAGFLTPKIYGRVPNGDGTSYDVILAAMSNNIINGTGTYSLFLYPAAQTVTTGTAQSQNGALTPAWRPVIVASASSNFKYSVTAVYVK